MLSLHHSPPLQESFLYVAVGEEGLEPPTSSV